MALLIFRISKAEIQIKAFDKDYYKYIEFLLVKAGFDFTKPIERREDPRTQEYVYYQYDNSLCGFCNLELHKDDEMIYDPFGEQDVHLECYENFLLNVREEDYENENEGKYYTW
jgi:hypothetical protein